ncbi:MAG: polysaccharide biosynthesis tyrosine autokinase, partial [Chloroflexota bacterium]
MELQTYLMVLWRRKWVIIITMGVLMSLAIAATSLITPTYKAKTVLRIQSKSSSVSYGDVLYAERLMNTYPNILKSSPFVNELQSRLGIDHKPEISVEFPTTSELMALVIVDEDPELAAEAANVLADLFISQVRKSKAGRNFTITLVDEANVPRNPASPNNTINLILGFIVSVAGGLGLALVFENFDKRLHTVGEIEDTLGYDVLARIPKVKMNGRVLLNGNTPTGEAYRRLRTNLLLPRGQETLKSVMVTSSEPGEGKSTTTANLALAIAHSGREVVVVDCDMRVPVMHQFFGLSNDIGLSSVLVGELPLEEAIRESEKPGLFVLSSGPPPSNPSELLGLKNMGALVEQLQEMFDVVLLDTPPLLPVIDAIVVLPNVDQTLLVVGSDQISADVIEATKQQLSLANANLAGVVLNRT